MAMQTTKERFEAANEAKEWDKKRKAAAAESAYSMRGGVAPEQGLEPVPSDSDVPAEELTAAERFAQTTEDDIWNDIKSVAQWFIPFVVAKDAVKTETVSAPGQRGGAKPVGHQAGGLGPGGGDPREWETMEKALRGRSPHPAEQQAASKASATARGVRTALGPDTRPPPDKLLHEATVVDRGYPSRRSALPKTGRGATQWTNIAGASEDLAGAQEARDVVQKYVAPTKWGDSLDPDVIKMGEEWADKADKVHSKAITQSLDNMRTYLNQSEIARDLAKGTTAAVKIAAPLLEFAGYLTGALAVPLIFFDEFEKSGHLPAQLKFMAQVGFQRPLESKDLSPRTRVLIRGNPASIERLWEEGTISDAFYESLTSPDDIASRQP